jgi:hypothetical protein
MQAPARVEKRGQRIGWSAKRDATRCTLLDDVGGLAKRRRSEATGMSLDVFHNRYLLYIFPLE